jgi:hypothetical protein
VHTRSWRSPPHRLAAARRALAAVERDQRFEFLSGGYRAAMPESYEPLDGRQQAVEVVFIALVAISIVACVFDILEVQLMDRIVTGDTVTEAEAAANDNRQGIIGVIQFAAYVAGAIVFIRWLRAAYRNSDVIAPGARRYGHGWAIGSWFVPFLNLWRPKQIVNDVWRAGGHDANDTEPGGLLVAWWTAFILSGWAANIALRGVFDDQTPEDLRDSSIALAISDGIDIFGAILAIFVVRAATDRLDGRAAELRSPEPEPLDGGEDAPERPAGLPV